MTHSRIVRRSAIRIFGKKSWGWKIVLGVGLLAGFSAAALAADTISGVARNQTLGQFAAGDEVTLLFLDQARPNHGMQEEARATTDSRGAFALKVRFPDKPHLLRVLHQGVNYDQEVSAGDVVSVEVFDAAARIQGVTGSVEIIRTGTHGNMLHVSDMIEIKNNSSPPLTLAGNRTFEVYLPAHAKIDSVLAAGSTRIGEMISAEPVPAEPGHYTVNFPLRPGATKFAFNYDLPYDGHASFRTRSVYPRQQLAVMIPVMMKFTSRSSAFQVLHTGNKNYQVEAANQVPAGEGPEFEISGVGAVPALRAQAQPPPKPPLPAVLVPAISAVGNSPAQAKVATLRGAFPVFSLSTASSKPLWWALGAGALFILAACRFLSVAQRAATPQGDDARGRTT